MFSSLLCLSLCTALEPSIGRGYLRLFRDSSSLLGTQPGGDWQRCKQLSTEEGGPWVPPWCYPQGPHETHLGSRCLVICTPHPQGGKTPAFLPPSTLQGQDPAKLWQPCV
jgi:hypothetical protein